MRRVAPVVGLAVGLALGGWGCGKSEQQAGSEGTQAEQAPAVETQPVTEAVATLEPTEGNDVSGTVTFTKVAGGIRIVADVDGLTPGKHGFHVHENGDCSAPDGSSAGGHFNPTNMPHGAPDDAQRHVGDLGNLVADENGHAHYDRIDTVIALEGEKSILDRGLIVHAGEDDFVTQPTGNAGARVACGVIRAK